VSDDAPSRYEGPKFRGDRALSPYPVSRLAPVHDLVDAAQEIQRADQVLGAAVNAKMSSIVEQIRALQAQARVVIAEARDDALLHRASCNFKKRIGAVYHLYERTPERVYFSMLSPEEWGDGAPHTFRGSFRLDPDMSWSRVDGEFGSRGDAEPTVPRLEIPELLRDAERRPGELGADES